MNLFGLILGQYILIVLLAMAFLALGSAMLTWGWIGKFFGLLLFPASAAWLTSIVLYDNARIPGVGLSASLLVLFLAAVFAAVRIYQQKDVPRRSLLAGRAMTVNKNGVIAGALVLITALVAFSFIAQGDWRSFFNFDSQAAQQAYDQTTNGVLRFANRLLRSLNLFLAR